MLLEHPQPRSLLPYLAKYPYETLPHNYIFRHFNQKGTTSRGIRKVWVDDLKSPSFVVIGGGNRYIVWAKNLWAFKRFLNDKDPTDSFFPCLLEKYAQYLQLHYNTNHENPAKLFIVPDDWIPPQIPDVPTRSLDLADASMITKLWPYSDNIDYIKSRIESGPSVGVYQKGCLVAFVLTHDDGSMGILHVLDEYRHHGYAQVISVRLIEQMRARGDRPWCAIIVGNKASLGLARKMGFKQVERASWLGII